MKYSLAVLYVLVVRMSRHHISNQCFLALLHLGVIFYVGHYIIKSMHLTCHLGGLKFIWEKTVNFCLYFSVGIVCAHVNSLY